MRIDLRIHLALVLSLGCARTPPAQSPAATAAEPAPTAAEAPAQPPAIRHPRLTLLGSEGRDVGLPGQGTATFYGPIFLGDDLAKAEGTVYLYLDGVVAEMGTEAEVYLTEPGKDRIDARYYTGSVANVPSGRTALGTITQEVHDFEADGVQHQARTLLRGLRSFGVAVLVRQGTLRLHQIVLTTAPPSQRTAD
ncbi:MAG: hypothetical protein H6747_01445 [Deltaproteobacteria bacterium]|nr:hypothetical protein [Deltaproteobacteria bacterium]